MNLKEYATKSTELHGKLNDVNYTQDINAEYKAFWSDSKDIQEQIAALFLVNGKYTSIHDCYVENFSQRKQVNDYRITFDVNAIIYQDKEEVGYQKVTFNIISKQKLRAISGRELYDFQIDERTKELLFMYWSHGLKSVVIQWSDFQIDMP